MTEAPGSIGPYQLLAKIGQGGMGTVHLAKLAGAVGVSKLAVVKVLHPHLSDSDMVVEMFLNEARLAARLTHPNVVHTYGADEDQGRLYIAMEHLDGQPWSRVRRRLWTNRSLPLASHLKVLVDTLAGLHYAHELRDYDGSSLSVVHCDVSPHNIFVTYEGQAKIVDFGVARAMTGTEMPHAEQFAGKLAYAAPEQLTGEGIDRRADIFAVGVMLWEALAGRSYVSTDDRVQLVRDRVKGREARVRDVVSTVPRALADICDRATARVRDERFATAQEMRQALLGYLSQHSLDADDVQLGRLIASAFRDERRQLHALIEHHLRTPSTRPKRVSQPSVRPSVPPKPSPQASELSQRVERQLVGQVEEVENTMRADLSEFASVSKIEDDRVLADASVVASVRAARRSWSRRVVMATAAGIGLLVGLLGLVVWGGPSPTAQPLASPGASKDPSHASVAQSGEATAAATPASNADRKPARAASTPADDDPEPAVERTAGSNDERSARSGSARRRRPKRARAVQVELAVSPKNATLYLDGKQLPSNPFRGRLPRDGATHTLRAEAGGFASKSWQLELDRNLRLHESLPRKQDAVSSGTAPGEPATTVASAPASSASASESEASAKSAPKPEPASEATASDTPQPGDKLPGYGARVEPDRAPRKIFVEDPYQ